MSEDLETLTRAERRCLLLCAESLDSKEIARRLGGSPHTIDDHFRSINSKLGVTSRRQAARLLRTSELHPQWLRDEPLGMGAEASFPQFQATAATGGELRDVGVQFPDLPTPLSAADDRRSKYDDLTSSKLTRLRELGWLVAIVFAVVALTPAMANSFQIIARAIKQLLE